MLVRTALTIVGSIGLLLWLNVRLALLALIMGPLVGWLVSIINRKFRRYSRRIQDSMGDVTRVAKESFEAPRLIKVYNAPRSTWTASSTRSMSTTCRSNMRLILTRGISNPVVQMLTALGRGVRAVDCDRRCGARPHDHGRSARLHHGAGGHRATAARSGRRRRPAAAGHRRRPEPV